MSCLKVLCRASSKWTPGKANLLISYRPWDGSMELSSQRQAKLYPIIDKCRSMNTQAFAAPIQTKPSFQATTTACRLLSHRRPSVCDFCMKGADEKPCFDITKVEIQRATQCHAKLIRSFLYTHHWPREPSVTGLWLALDSPYLAVLTERYATSGERYLAFEHEPRTRERKLIGVLVANKVFPWAADELEEWAHYTISRPERHRMYFVAHCLRKPDLFNKYHLDYLWDIEVLCTAAHVTGHGVGTLLMRSAVQHAIESRYPCSHFIAYSTYASKICRRINLKREWSMNYTDFVDHAGQRLFYPRRPHFSVDVYTKRLSCELGFMQPWYPASYSFEKTPEDTSRCGARKPW